MLSLTNKQQNATYYLKDNITTELIFGGGAGGGKSALGVLWLIDGSTRYAGTRWLMGRSKLKNLKDTTLNTFFELTTKLGISDQYDYNQQRGIITWWNGSEIILKDLFHYPSDPNYDSLGSLEITGAFIDECNQITFKAWQIVKSRIRYKLDENNLIPKVLGTCNPAKNWVYNKFYKPDADKDLPDYRKFIQSLATDNPYISHHYINNLNTLDDQSKNRLLFGNWEYDDNPNALCDYDDILGLFTNDHVQGEGHYLSVDVARYGSDKAIIGLWKGLKLIEIFEYAKSSTVMLQSKIKELRVKYQITKNRCVVDGDGVGGGVVDNTGVVDFVNGSKALGGENYRSLRDQCGYKLSEKINLGEIYISAKLSDKQKEDIILEIEYLQSYELDKGGKLRILPKDKIKSKIGRSPDYMDMLLMRMYFLVKPKVATRYVAHTA